MLNQYTLFLALSPFATLVALAAMFQTWRYTRTPGASALTWYLLAATGFLVTNTFELLTPTIDATLFWARLEYIFIAFSPAAWLGFALQYTGRARYLAPERFWPLFILPIITLGLALTNEEHGLIWQAYSFFEVGDHFLALKVTHGAWFWVHSFYAYTTMITGGILIAKEYFASKPQDRRHSLWLVVGALMPLISNVIYIFRLIPGLSKDYSPLSFVFAGVAFAIGIMKIRLFDLRPAARAILVDRMRDGMIVIDAGEQVVDLNPAARRILKVGSEGGIRQPVEQILPGWSNYLKALSNTASQQIEITIHHYGTPIHYELEVLKLTKNAGAQRMGQPGSEDSEKSGSLIILHDIDRRKRAEEELVRLNIMLSKDVEDRTLKLQRRAAELEALAGVSTALRRAGSLDDMQSILLEETVEALGAENGAILLLEENELVITALRGLPGSLAGYRHPPCSDPFWQVVEKGEQVFILLDPSQTGEPYDLLARMSSGKSGMAIVPLRTAQKTIGVLQLGFGRTAGEFTKEQGRILTAIAEMSSNTFQRVQVMEMLEHLVRDRTRDLRVLYEVTAITNEVHRIQEILGRVLEKSLEVLQSRAGMIHLIDDNESVYLAAQHGLFSELAQVVEAPHSENSLCHRVISSDQMLLINDWPAEMQITELDCPPDMLTYIGVPIHARGNVLGALSLFGESIHNFSAEDIALLAGIADQAGIAIEAARLRQKAEDTAVMEERQRLARDLHDSVTQLLYSLNLFTEAGQDSARAGDLPLLQHYLNRAGDTAQQALKEMRLLIYELRPLALQQDGLVGAIRQRLEAVERRVGIETQLSVETPLELTAAVEVDLYRIVQESLNNVLKHSAATQVFVKIWAEEGSLYLQISDNGRGVDLSAPPSHGGIGMHSIRERVIKLGGSLQISSEPGKGLTLTATIPYPAGQKN